MPILDSSAAVLLILMSLFLLESDEREYSNELEKSSRYIDSTKLKEERAKTTSSIRLIDLIYTKQLREFSI